ncbi:MAG: site-2 protease family protein [Actinomycetota bacterium]|nr:site-2 protease family protein [Actinomycetota bacterium]
MDRYSHRENEARDTEPVFRSDTGERSEPPSYEPIRPEGGVWKTVKRLLAPLAAIGFLLAKFKFVLFALLKVKFVGTALTALLSIGAYALLFPLWFAAGLVALIWVHEMGHVLQLRREGIPASAPMFVPFLGAFVAMKQMPKNALVEARVGLAGPVLGTLGGLGVLGLYAWTQEPVFLALAYVGFFLNLINLLPVLPLDGGRAIGVLSPAFWILGVGLMVALMLTSAVSPLFIVIVLFFGGPELWRRWRTRNTPEGQAYHKIEPRHRFAVGLVYVALAVSLALLMGVTEVPAPPPDAPLAA